MNEANLLLLLFFHYWEIISHFPQQGSFAQLLYGRESPPLSLPVLCGMLTLSHLDEEPGSAQACAGAQVMARCMVC